MVNDESPWLSPDAVQEMTEAKRWATQCKRLAEMGVPFRPNAIGRPRLSTVVRRKRGYVLERFAGLDLRAKGARTRQRRATPW